MRSDFILQHLDSSGVDTNSNLLGRERLNIDASYERHRVNSGHSTIESHWPPIRTFEISFEMGLRIFISCSLVMLLSPCPELYQDALLGFGDD